MFLRYEASVEALSRCPSIPLGQVGVEPLLGGLDPGASLRLADLDAELCRRVPPAAEPTLEDDASGAVLEDNRVLDQEARAGLRQVFANTALARLPTP